MSVSNSQHDSSSQCPSRVFVALMEKAERQMKKKGYSNDAIYQHRTRWRQMARFFREQFGDDTFSVTKAAAFLESEGILFDHSRKPLEPRQWRIPAAVRSLTDVALHGTSCFKVPRASLDILPPRWKSALEAFLDYLINEAGRRPTSVKRTQYMLRQFLVHLADLGITEPTQLSRFHAQDYLASRLHWKRNTLHINARLITQLLRYLYLNGLHPEDLSGWVPRIPRVVQRIFCKKLFCYLPSLAVYL